jgi:hypothetical protein
MSDIGAIDPGSWQDWHFAWKIGATSFENVTARSAARAVPATAITMVPTTVRVPYRPIRAIFRLLFESV